MNEPLKITTDNFAQLVEAAAKPILVDFWAAWCMPCRMLAPTIDEIAQEMDEKLLVGKVNVDNSPELSAKFSVMSIPTLILFSEGKAVDKMVGVNSKDDIMAMVDRHIK